MTEPGWLTEIPWQSKLHEQWNQYDKILADLFKIFFQNGQVRQKLRKLILKNNRMDFNAAIMARFFTVTNVTLYYVFVV